MKVKSCYLARAIESEEVLKEYTEKLGCTIRHQFSPSDEGAIYTIEDATGNKSVLVLFPEPMRSQFKNYMGTRVVVDNIQEGIDFFKAEGYEICGGPAETDSNFVCSMRKGDEFRIVFEHKKNHK